jgi:8-oxo-dGTP pyrophosphatase MutT (NUDIX family)
MLNPNAQEFVPKNIFSIKESKSPRPKFLFNNKEVLSAGVLFYTIIDNNTYYLLRKDNSKKNYNKWSDLGGKSDKEDKVLFDTITRELLEETNNEINKLLNVDSFNALKAWIIKSNYKIIYNKICKYLIFKIRLYDLKITDFSNIYAEDTVVSWKYIDKDTKILLHPRLKKKYLNN